MEIWKNVFGLEGFYEVSNLGNLKRLKRFNGHTITEKICKGCLDKYGYLVTTIRINKNKKMYKIHRLVALTFIPNPENKPQVNHINGIKTDNRIENLEWCTNSENQIHAHRIGLKTGNKGDKCNFYGLTGEKNINARKIINIKTNQTFNSIKEASDFYNIKYNILSKNLNGQNINKTDLVYF